MLKPRISQGRFPFALGMGRANGVADMSGAAALSVGTSGAAASQTGMAGAISLRIGMDGGAALQATVAGQASVL